MHKNSSVTKEDNFREKNKNLCTTKLIIYMMTTLKALREGDKYTECCFVSLFRMRKFVYRQSGSGFLRKTTLSQDHQMLKQIHEKWQLYP